VLPALGQLRPEHKSLDDYFECPACGAAWQAPIAVGPEECAFTERASDGERKGAA
jgi:transcription elongation factor Elf1